MDQPVNSSVKIKLLKKQLKTGVPAVTFQSLTAFLTISKPQITLSGELPGGPMVRTPPLPLPGLELLPWFAN